MQVAEYVQERIANLRRDHEAQYQNISCIRTNSQKFLVHYFRKGQLQKLFFLFPVGRLLLSGPAPACCRCFLTLPKVGAYRFVKAGANALQAAECSLLRAVNVRLKPLAFFNTTPYF